MGDSPSPSVLYFDPKKSTENFARLCQFLLTICSDVMRDILSHYIKPANLRRELDQNRSKMSKLNAQERDLLYPPHSSTSSVPPIRSKDLDLSLLYKILRNLCNIPTHIAGWGNQPRPSDFSLAACIERIRILRNSISGHSTDGTVEDVEFEDTWRELRTSVVEIEKEVIGSDRYKRGIDHLYDCDLNPTKSKEYVAQIRRCSGELKVKRERIDLIEEEAKAKRVRLETVEERQSILDECFSTLRTSIEARLTEVLTAVNSNTCILKELKSTKQGLLQEKGQTPNSNSGTDKYGDTSTNCKSTTIKFKSTFPSCHFSMHVTRDNKCWLLVPRTGFKCWLDLDSEIPPDSSLYLLSDIGVDKEIKIPKEYDAGLNMCNITVNDDGEAVFVSRMSLIAAGENGVVRKLFYIHELFTDNCRVCFMLPGTCNYVVQCPFGTFYQYTKNGDFLGNWGLPLKCTIPNLQHPQSSLYQNSNEDFIFTNVDPLVVSSHLCVFNKNLELKCTVNIDKVGIITPVFNKTGHLLCGHSQSIDLLDSNGDFVRNICKTNRRNEIIKIAYSKNGTLWILFDSYEIDIRRLGNL